MTRPKYVTMQRVEALYLFLFGLGLGSLVTALGFLVWI